MLLPSSLQRRRPPPQNQFRSQFNQKYFTMLQDLSFCWVVKKILSQGSRQVPSKLKSPKISL